MNANFDPVTAEPVTTVGKSVFYCDGNIVFGVGPVRPIVNLPAGVLKIRIRQRCNELTRIFLRFSDRIERWEIEDEPAGWRLLFCISSNSAPPIRVHSRPFAG